MASNVSSSLLKFEDDDIQMASSDDFESNSAIVVEAELSEQHTDIDSDVEILGNSSEFDSDWRVIGLGVEADPMCKRLNRLIKAGKIPKERIFYKYLSDVVEIFYNPLYSWDSDVVEFFSSLAYLGGQRMYNMVREPMQAGQGRLRANKGGKVNMNLGGPSTETLRKKQAAHSTESGVHKHLSDLNYTL